MPANQEPAVFYRREAERLRSMADSPIFFDVRPSLLEMAQRYDAMAEQAAVMLAHNFGLPAARSRHRA